MHPDFTDDPGPLELADRCLALVTGFARKIASEGWDPTIGPQIDAAMRQASTYALVSIAHSLDSLVMLRTDGL
jgi:hypothetical protein